MSSDEIPVIPRPARLPTPVEAVPVSPAPRAQPKQRSEVFAAGALFVILMALMSMAAGAITLVMFV